jgi:DNA helicase II / ATP-dependent DNA helicase PcrA
MSVQHMQNTLQDDLLSSLNGEQRKAVEHLDGPVLVLAGAGTGKTKVLTSRLSNLLFQGKARAFEILAVTFTNRASREMRERVGHMVGNVVEGLWLGTFHSIGTRILRRHAELLGFKSSFSILDADDQLRLVKQLIEAEHIDDKKWVPKSILGQFQRWKDRGLTPERVLQQGGEDSYLGSLYRLYQERLQILNAMDFGDLLLHCLTLFELHPEILSQYQTMFKYILVDEYQDTNVAQYLWLRLLAQKHKNMCCVGDDDQSIYSWRGAEVKNILRFETDFPGCLVVRLEQNYRSTGHILSCASALISHNENRLEKTLWTDVDGGEKITVRGVWDNDDEARFVLDEIETLNHRGHKLHQIAILVRAGFQTRAFEERFIKIGLPYKVIGGLRFYERQEIRDAIAYMRVLVQPDDSLAFERILNVPKRAIGPQSVQMLHNLAREQKKSLYAIAYELVETDELRPQVKRNMKKLIDDFERWRDLLNYTDHANLTEQMLDESGYTSMWQNDKTPEAPGRLENLKELMRALSEFENLQGFLEHVSLVTERAEKNSGDEVILMTLHSAKGLEFETVFLPGWEEGVFPHQKSLDEGGSSALEEERRLAYVGLTRAKKKAFITYAANRRMYNQWQSAYPSRFLAELPKENIIESSPRGVASPYKNNDSGSSYNREPSYGRSYGSSAPQRQLKPPVYDNSSNTGHYDWEVLTPKDSGYKPGDQVFHEKFGNGTVLGTDGQKLDIDFGKGGIKKVMANFVKKG